MIDYSEYIISLNVQFVSLINSDEKFKSFKDHFILCDEQFINKNVKKITPNNIYGVINFGTASIEYGQTQLAISIDFLGQLNDISLLQELLNLYVETYNLKYLYNSNILQTYVTPVLNSNFNQIDAGFRGIFTIAGALLITQNLIDISKLEYKNSNGEYEEIEYLKITSQITNSALPEAFSGTSGRTISTLQFQTQTLSIALYPLNSAFLTSLMKSQIEKDGDFTEKYTIKLTYNNGIESEFDYVLTSIYHEKAKAGIPSLSLVFTRG